MLSAVAAANPTGQPLVIADCRSKVAAIGNQVLYCRRYIPLHTVTYRYNQVPYCRRGCRHSRPPPAPRVTATWPLARPLVRPRWQVAGKGTESESHYNASVAFLGISNIHAVRRPPAAAAPPDRRAWPPRLTAARGRHA